LGFWGRDVSCISAFIKLHSKTICGRLAKTMGERQGYLKGVDVEGQFSAVFLHYVAS